MMDRSEDQNAKALRFGALLVLDQPNRAGANLGGIGGTRFVIAPSSQESEPPRNPERFTSPLAWSTYSRCTAGSLPWS